MGVIGSLSDHPVVREGHSERLVSLDACVGTVEKDAAAAELDGIDGSLLGSVKAAIGLLLDAKVLRERHHLDRLGLHDALALLFRKKSARCV